MFRAPIFPQRPAGSASTAPGTALPAPLVIGSDWSRRPMPGQLSLFTPTSS